MNGATDQTKSSDKDVCASSWWVVAVAGWYEVESIARATGAQSLLDIAPKVDEAVEA